MPNRFILLVAASILSISACDEKTESSILDLEQDYQPLAIGYFWIYEVDETIYFGENDSESSEYFLKDFVRTSYVNEEKEMTFVISRYTSTDKVSWVLDLEYTMIYRDKILLRTVNNTPIAALVFPPVSGRIWNGKSYQAEGEDDFEIDLSDWYELPGFENVPSVKVLQENLDDKITIRDIRYEVFGKGVGLLEKYEEVLTYCSRNDCLGDELIDSGSKTHLKLVEYETN